jgi:epoxyqueuosine reductase
VVPSVDVEALRRVALEAGADVFGATSSSPFAAALETLESRKVMGLAGPIHLTYDDPETASDVRRTFPWARSLVVVGCSYVGDASPPAERGAVIGRFGTKDHYGRVRCVTRAVAEVLEGNGARTAALIDDNRLLDRAAAARAGLGWIGKSTMVLSPGHGPWLLLGSVATDLELEDTPPMRRSCGTCTACIPACPTGAITPEGLDSRRCISAWLQASGSIPHWVRPLIERRIYGCDDCLTSCPPGGPALSLVKAEAEEISFADLLASGDAELLARFEWWYIPHRDPRFLRRNILIAAGNSEEESAIPQIVEHFTHRSSMVRGHAYWAYARSRGIHAWAELRDRYADETVPDARAELEWALSMVREPTGG